MNEEPTPETDMLLSNQLFDNIPYDDAALQLAELCCKLERERDYALARLERIKPFLWSVFEELENNPTNGVQFEVGSLGVEWAHEIRRFINEECE